MFLTTTLLTLLLFHKPSMAMQHKQNIWNDRPRDWPNIENVLWRSSKLANTYFTPCNVTESWGVDRTPWDIVEAIDEQCPKRSCDMNITIPTHMMINDNEWPVKVNATLRVHASFDEKPYSGTKRDFVDVLQLFLRVMDDSTVAESLLYRNGTGENGKLVYKRMYTAPKYMHSMINNKNDDQYRMPFMTVQFDSPARRRQYKGVCDSVLNKRVELATHMEERFGERLTLLRLACLQPKEFVQK